MGGRAKPPRRKRRVCAGHKKVYETRKHAAFDARRIRDKTDDWGFETYWCRDCRGWHVGSLNDDAFAYSRRD